MTNEQIKAIIKGCEASLQIVLSDSSYQKIQQSDCFTTNNDLTLGDAIQALNEVLEGISTVEYFEGN
ncbi:hypothetical protein [Nostoc sp. CHAB 5715]|uniref:hypothetical protein n=1 Tax=Nostoc sp. CHAB 5715 TaxID=2780400 RepID=UPI001E3FC3E0|nr:hypothetical protein [Nostoc sp. CHAB 5715]MCC5620810.1 hypothetical protein [Nostoc sp. CHAB 5715]